MPNIKIYGVAVHHRKVVDAILEALRALPNDLTQELCISRVDDEPLSLEGTSQPFADISAGRSTPRVSLRAIAAALLPILDVELVDPLNGTKQFYRKGTPLVPKPNLEDLRINHSELLGFLVHSAKSGYASRSNQSMKEANGSESIFVDAGDWQSHDNWFGGDSFCGRTVVTYQEVPVWIMNYQGSLRQGVNKAYGSSVFDFLRRALNKLPADAPFRGPRDYREDRWHYESRTNGDHVKFEGFETITVHDDPACYIGHYHGCLLLP